MRPMTADGAPSGGATSTAMRLMTEGMTAAAPEKMPAMASWYQWPPGTADQLGAKMRVVVTIIEAMPNMTMPRGDTPRCRMAPATMLPTPLRPPTIAVARPAAMAPSPEAAAM